MYDLDVLWEKKQLQEAEEEKKRAEEAEKEEQKKRKRAEQTYEVEYITQKRILDGEIEYRVHWKNYNARQRTWEKESELSHCRRAIAAFEQKFKTAKH